MDRIKVLQIIIFSVAFLIIFRLFYWQFISDIKSSNVLGLQDIRISAPRGEILASDGFPLVTNQEAFLLFAKLGDIRKDKAIIARELAPFLISEKYATQSASLSESDQQSKEDEIGEKEEEIEDKLNSENLAWVQLGRKIPLDLKEKIQSLDTKGLGFESDNKRFYPESSMSAQLLGFVASDKFGEDTGYFGLEGYYDNRLKGKSGRLSQALDPFGFPILIGDYNPISSRRGGSLQLSIDRSIQYIVEQILSKSVEKYGAKEGTVIVAEPSTGKILAMATYPTYTPYFFGEFSDDLYRNQAVADTYEPGSTFKLITMAAALDSGVVKPETKCPVCTGPRIISGHKVSTWNDEYYPDSTMTEVIQHSDNIGMTFVAEELGKEKLSIYLDKFGFYDRTGIDLQEEALGNIRDVDDWRPIDLATASFGQGLAITPIQMIQAVQAIANGGIQIPPKVVEKIIDSDGDIDIVSSKEKQVISSKTASQITEMMVNAVVSGEAQVFAPKGYRIAGKTGTAQIPVEGNYDPEKTVASFIGFAPADDPKFIMLVRFTEPTSSPYGSETAAPAFFAIATDVLRYLGISPAEN